MAIQQGFWSLVLIISTLLFSSCGSGNGTGELLTPLSGGEYYENNCVTCHGDKGDKGTSGSANLKTSKLSRKQIRSVIMKGQGNMSSYKSLFENDSIGLENLVDHVITLRK